MAQHRILDIFGDLLEGLGLVVMRVDIDDQKVLIVPLHGLLGGIAQQRARIELLVGKIAKALYRFLHDRLRLSVAARCGCQTPDSGHRLPRTQFEHLEPDAFQQRRTPDRHIGHRDPAVAPERSHCVTHLSLRRIEPEHRAKNLSERIVGYGIDAILVDRLGTRSREGARQRLERLARLRL